MVMKKLYEVLGVEETATTEEIKKAHRKLVKEHHPDKGGDPEKFAKIQEAYEVLSDDARRKRYDETGQYDEVKDTFHQEFAGFVSQIIIPEIEGAAVLDFDLMGIAAEVIKRNKKSGAEQIKQAEKQKDRLERYIPRFGRTDDGEDFITAMIEQRVKAFDNAIERMGKEMDILDRLQEELTKYEYQFDDEEYEEEMLKRIEEGTKKWITVHM